MKKTILCSLFLLLAFLPAWAGAAETPKKEKKEKEEPVVWGEMPAGAKTAYIGIHGGTVPVSLLSSGDGSPMIAMVGLTGNDFLNFLRTNGRLREEPVLPEFPAPQFASEPADTYSISVPSSNATQSQAALEQKTASASALSGKVVPSNLPNLPTLPKAPVPASGNPLDGVIAGNSVVSQSDAVPTELTATQADSPDPGVNATLLLAGTSGGDIPVIYATGRTFERMSLIPENWAPFGLTEKALSLEGEIKILAAPKKMPRATRKSSKK